MIFLILSILASSLIFVIFRVFPKLKVDTFQAIVFNYFTACLCGFSLYGNEFKSEALVHTDWMYFAVLCGILFISLFLVMGISSQKNGVALTSVSVKMSMAMTMLLMIVWYGESITILKITGIILAISGVLLMSWSKNSQKSETKPILWMLVLLFVGSGALDFALNFVQNNMLTYIPSSLFSAVGFGIAGTIGIVILIIQIARKKSQFHFRNVLAGIGLGIPNYFSIYLLMKSYSEMKPWSDSTVLAITNVSIVVLSAFYGFILFKEKFSALKAFGLLASLAAILVLYFASL
ncbi:MAG: EamA family transporter [Flavobacteriia bacterium]|jgi:drug/metabolite transporter (DMT)-like permease